MGTRGYFGFFYKGKYYLIYNHYDSYPSYLGKKLVEEIKKAIADGSFGTWIEMFKQLKFYNSYEELSRIDSDKIEQSYINILKEGYMVNNGDKNKLTNDIFIEHSYVLDFDTNIFLYFNSEGDEEHYKLDNLPEW